jgi:hypothetical protein
VLKRLIETVGSDTIRINWDPANLILWPARYAKDAGEEYDKQKWMDLYQPVEGLDMVGEYVVHVHAKDALVHDNGERQEVAFGTGWVDWDAVHRQAARRSRLRWLLRHRARGGREPGRTSRPRLTSSRTSTPDGHSSTG